MKNLVKFLLFILCLSNYKLDAQNSIGINTNTPHTSSILDISSNSKGVLIPRMAKKERVSIPNPATGLMVYQGNDTVGFYYYDSSKWSKLSTTNSELQRITENGKTGYRLLGKDTAFYGNIGVNAIDLSHGSDSSDTRGATGNHAAALGTGTSAPSFSETVVGMNNTEYSPNSKTAHNLYDRAFTVGIGASAADKRDGLIVYKDGTIGLHQFSENEPLYHVDNVLYNYNGILYLNGYSVDQSPLVASGFYGIRRRLHANDNNFAPIGSYATDLTSITGGNSKVGASGDFSFTANVNTKAQNYYSAAIGENTISQTRSEFSVGAFNDTITQPTAFTWYSTDRIFQVGTGQSNATRSSSLVIFKNGRMLIAPANGAANEIPGGNTSYTGWQKVANWNINDPASLEVAPTYNSNNSTLKVFGRNSNSNITILKDSAIVDKKMISFKAGLNVAEIGTVTIAASGNGINYNTTSDRRLKIDKGRYSNGLSTINNMTIHQYQWKSNGKDDIGVFAQELYRNFPNAVTKGDDKETNDPASIEQRWQVDYSKLVPVLISAVQELSERNNAFEKENNALKKELNDIFTRLSKLEKGDTGLISK